MKKIITAAVAALMCMNMISCSKGDNSNLNSSRSFTAEKLSDKAYKKIKVPLPENLNTLYSFKTSPKGHMIIGTIGSESPVFLHAIQTVKTLLVLILKTFLLVKTTIFVLHPMEQ